MVSRRRSNRKSGQEAFQPYYEHTIPGDEVDPHKLYELQTKVMGRHVVFAADVEEFAKVYYAPGNRSARGCTRSSMLCSTRASFGSRNWTRRSKTSIEGFLLILYSFLSQVIPYQDSDLEKIYTYVRFLLTRLPRRESGPRYDFEDEVMLKYYRLQKISEGSIQLTQGKGGEVKGPTEVGTGQSHEEEVELSSLIESLNERFGTDFTKEDELFFQQVKQDVKNDEKVRQTAEANTLQNFGYVFDKAFEGFVVARLDRNQDVGVKVLSNDDLKKFLTRRMRREVYDEVRSEVEAGPAGS